MIFIVASMDSTAQTGQSSVGDLQEEVYQKVKTPISYYIYFLTKAGWNMNQMNEPQSKI